MCNFEAPALDAAVDLDAHVISGISVIASGEALGHGMLIDEKTLQQVADFGNAHPGGLKSRYTHPGMSADGLGRHLGRLHDFRVEGTKVSADLWLSSAAAESPEGDLRSYVETLAREDPEAAGLSIVAYLTPVWRVGSEEVETWERPENATTKVPLARLEVVELASGEKLNPLRAADLVDEPAANRAGMFAANSLAGRAGMFAPRSTNGVCVAAFAALDERCIRDADLDPEALSADPAVRRFLDRHGVSAKKLAPFVAEYTAWRARKHFMKDDTNMNAAGEAAASAEEHGGKAGLNPAPQGETPAAAADAEPDEPAEPSGLMARVRSMLSTQRSLTKLTRNYAARLKVAEDRAEELEASAAEFREEFDAQGLRLAEALEENCSAAELAAEIVASAGVPGEELPNPASGAELAEPSVDDLRTQLKTTQDAAARRGIVEQLREARGWSMTSDAEGE